VGRPWDFSERLTAACRHEHRCEERHTQSPVPERTASAVASTAWTAWAMERALCVGVHGSWLVQRAGDGRPPPGRVRILSGPDRALARFDAEPL